VWRCVYALGLLLALAIGNYWTGQVQQRETRHVTQRLSLSSRQVALVYRTAALAERLLQETPVTELPVAHPRPGSTAAELLTLVREMEQNHLRLVHGDPATGLPATDSPHVRGLFFDPSPGLDRLSRAYIRALGRLVQPGAPLRDQPEELAALRALLAEVQREEVLQNGLNAVTNYYRNEGEVQLYQGELLDVWHLASTIGVLGLMAALVFFPLIRRIAAVVEGLARLNATLEQRVAERTADLHARAGELERSNAALREVRTAMENAVEGIARLTVAETCASANAAFAELFGMTPAALVGTPWQDAIAPADHAALAQALTQARDHGKAEIEVQARAVPGSPPVYLQLTFVPVWTVAQTYDGVYCFAKNITSRKHTEQALRESEERFRMVAEHVDQVLWLSEPGGPQLVYVSPAFGRLFGQACGAPREALAVWDAAIHADDRERVRQARQTKQLAGSYDEEYRIVRPDGQMRWVRDRAFPIRAGGGPSPIAGIAEDVTQARELQQQLLLSQRSFEHLIMACDVALLVTDQAGRVKFINPAAERLLGRSARSLLDQVLEYATSAAERLELPLLHDGLPVGVAEFTLLRTEWDGEVAHLLIGHDITARKLAEAELQAYAAELKRSNKELEDFAFVASHDLQEPLRKIKAFGDRLVKRFGATLGPDGKEYLDRMQNAADRMNDLIQALLTYSRVTTKAQPFTLVDLNQIAREVLADLEVRIEQSRGQVLVEPLPAIQADPMQMRQLLQNLIGNALKFRREGVPPVVRVSCEPVTDRPTSLHETQHAMEERIRLLVADNGIGFDEKYLDRIFEVFQRLHGRGQYEGTGTGLAVCRKIAQRHGGTITARSRPDEGATFIVTLPIGRRGGG
jgi:PAS domain S-box-containing protein